MEKISTNETHNDNRTAGNGHFFNFFTLSNIYNDVGKKRDILI